MQRANATSAATSPSTFEKCKKKSRQSGLSLYVSFYLTLFRGVHVCLCLFSVNIIAGVGTGRGWGGGLLICETVVAASFLSPLLFLTKNYAGCAGTTHCIISFSSGGARLSYIGWEGQI